MKSKTGQSWFSAVISTKQDTFEMQLHIIVVSVFQKTCNKDHQDSSSRLLKKKIACLPSKQIGLHMNSFKSQCPCVPDRMGIWKC